MDYRNKKICFTISNLSYYNTIMAKLIEDIKKAIQQHEKTRYVLSKETGISQSHLSQLMAGTKGLSYDALEALVDALDLEIVVRTKSRKKGKKHHGN